MSRSTSCLPTSSRDRLPGGDSCCPCWPARSSCADRVLLPRSVGASDRAGDIEAKQQTNAQLQSQIDSLQKYDELQVQAQQAQSQLDAAYAGEVSFSGMLMDLSRVIPCDAYLSTFSTRRTAAAGSTPSTTAATTTTPLIGTMTFRGETLHFSSLSTWLNRLESVQGWANPWTPNVTADPAVAGAFQFDTSVDLTQDALTQRGAAGAGVSGG